MRSFGQVRGMGDARTDNRVQRSEVRGSRQTGRPSVVWFDRLDENLREGPKSEPGQGIVRRPRRNKVFMLLLSLKGKKASENIQISGQVDKNIDIQINGQIGRQIDSDI